MLNLLIVRPDNKPFDVVIKDEASLSQIVAMMPENAQFKVFSSGAQLMPEHFGWKAMKNWVEQFDYEDKPDGYVFKHPFRLSHIKRWVVVDAEGNQVVCFRRCDEALAEEMVKYMNRSTQHEQENTHNSP